MAFREPEHNGRRTYPTQREQATPSLIRTAQLHRDAAWIRTGEDGNANACDPTRLGDFLAFCEPPEIVDNKAPGLDPPGMPTSSTSP